MKEEGMGLSELRPPDLTEHFGYIEQGDLDAYARAIYVDVTAAATRGLPLLHLTLSMHLYEEIFYELLFESGTNGARLFKMATIHDNLHHAEFAIISRAYQDVESGRLIAARNEAEGYLDILCHDVANYCTPIRAYSELCTMDPQMPVGVQTTARKVLDQVNRISELITRLRRLTERRHVRPMDFIPVDLRRVISEVSEEVSQHHAERKIQFALEFPEGQAFVLADEGVTDIVRNLLTNAIQYDPHEEIRLAVGLQRIVSREGAAWELTVSDHGRGIPPDERDRILHRLEEPAGLLRGIGLGLSITNLLTRHYRGEIWIADRVPGSYREGTAVHVRLPAARDQ